MYYDGERAIFATDAAGAKWFGLWIGDDRDDEERIIREKWAFAPYSEKVANLRTMFSSKVTFTNWPSIGVPEQPVSVGFLEKELLPDACVLVPAWCSKHELED